MTSHPFPNAVNLSHFCLMESDVQSSNPLQVRTRLVCANLPEITTLSNTISSMKTDGHLPIPEVTTQWLQALPASGVVAKVARSTGDTRLPLKARRGLGVFIRYLTEVRLPPVSRLILFGSHARDDFRPESDVDLAIVLAGEAPEENAGSEALRLTHALTDADIASFDESHILVAPVVLWESDLLWPEKHRRPSFYRNILSDGILITTAL